jgi:DNA-binding transcriptional ArsR family regulator
MGAEARMSLDQLSSVFGALADPTRRAILARLAEGDLAVRDLAAPFPMSQPAISRHLKVLESAGLISRSRRATARLSHLEAEPLREVTAWLARYQAYWDERFDKLDELLAHLQRRPSSATPSAPTKTRKASKARKQEGRTPR